MRLRLTRGLSSDEAVIGRGRSPGSLGYGLEESAIGVSILFVRALLARCSRCWDGLLRGHGGGLSTHVCRRGGYVLLACLLLNRSGRGLSRCSDRLRFTADGRVE